MIKSLHIPLYLSIKEDAYYIRDASGPANFFKLWWGCKTNPKYYLDFYSSKAELDLVKQSIELIGPTSSGYVFTNKHNPIKSIEIPTWTNSLGQSITSSIEVTSVAKSSTSTYPIFADDKYGIPYKIVGGFDKHYHKFFVGLMSGFSSFAPIFIAPVRPFETSRCFASPEAQILVQQWAEHLAANKDVKDFLLASNSL